MMDDLMGAPTVCSLIFSHSFHHPSTPPCPPCTQVVDLNAVHYNPARPWLFAVRRWLCVRVFFLGGQKRGGLAVLCECSFKKIVGGAGGRRCWG